MSAFNPEIAVKALLPKEILSMSSSLHLGIHLHKYFVQAVVFDPETNEILWNGHFDVEDATGDWSRPADFAMLRNWGERVYRKVTISFDQSDFTLVPQGFLEKGKEGELLRFATNKQADAAETEVFSDLGVALIYDLPSEIAALSKRFPNARFYPSTGLFIRECARIAKSNSKFFVMVQDGFMLVSAFHQGIMKLTNHYGVQGNDDVLYHIANAAMRLNIHLESSEVLLMGFGITSELEQLLKSYIQKVDVWTSANYFLF
jgi:hypothetical protein